MLLVFVVQWTLCRICQKHWYDLANFATKSVGKKQSGTEPLQKQQTLQRGVTPAPKDTMMPELAWIRLKRKQHAGIPIRHLVGNQDPEKRRGGKRGVANYPPRSFARFASGPVRHRPLMKHSKCCLPCQSSCSKPLWPATSLADWVRRCDVKFGCRGLEEKMRIPLPSSGPAPHLPPAWAYNPIPYDSACNGLVAKT